MRLIWSTRGREWGFRFLRTGGMQDPLPIYEEVFRDVGRDHTLVEAIGEKFAVRFRDPDHRDRSGRPIPHEFVIWGTDVRTPEQAREIAEQAVRDEYTDEVWAAEKGPRPLP